MPDIKKQNMDALFWVARSKRRMRYPGLSPPPYLAPSLSSSHGTEPARVKGILYVNVCGVNKSLNQTTKTCPSQAFRCQVSRPQCILRPERVSSYLSRA